MLSSLIDVLAASALVSNALASTIPTRRGLQESKREIINRTELSALGFPVPDPTESYWQVPEHRIANLHTTEELPTNETFDYVIVGSGISGAAIAYKLLNRDPNLSILMLEARKAASGASGRNGGHVRPGDWSSIVEWVDLYGEDEALKIQKLEQECVDDMVDFVQSHNVSSGFHEVESADLFWTKEAFEKAVKVWEYQQELDQRRPEDVGKNKRTVYTGQAARDHWGWPEILGAITFRSATQNPYLTVCAMLEQSLSKGLNLQTNTMALSLSQLSTTTSEGAKWEVQTDRGTVQGKNVVLATNGFTNALHPGIGSTKFLAPGRSQASAVHPSAYSANNSVWSRSASYGDRDTGGNYIVVRAPGDPGEGDVIYGGGQMFSPTRERNITDDSVINEDIALHLHRVGRQVYGYENWGETTDVLKDWTGITCYTEDGFPAVGAMPGEDGLWASVCMNGHGMAWAFRSAEALVEMMVSGEAPEWFPEAFDVKRAFAEGE
ncbi:DAO-domain-containing protein [Phaeosphaeriaceae sp. SRC1lsM3a]|nr:DAO-domain-containing protein [Stagonospora sp. SRC1lsM3a]